MLKRPRAKVKGALPLCRGARTGKAWLLIQFGALQLLSRASLATLTCRHTRDPVHRGAAHGDGGVGAVGAGHRGGDGVDPHAVPVDGFLRPSTAKGKITRLCPTGPGRAAAPPGTLVAPGRHTCGMATMLVASTCGSHTPSQQPAPGWLLLSQGRAQAAVPLVQRSVATWRAGAARESFQLRWIQCTPFQELELELIDRSVSTRTSTWTGVVPAGGTPCPCKREKRGEAKRLACPFAARAIVLTLLLRLVLVARPWIQGSAERGFLRTGRWAPRPEGRAMKRAPAAATPGPEPARAAGRTPAALPWCAGRCPCCAARPAACCCCTRGGWPAAICVVVPCAYVC